MKSSLGYKTTVKSKGRCHGFMQRSFDCLWVPACPLGSLRMLFELDTSARDKNLALASLQCCGMSFCSIIRMHGSYCRGVAEGTSHLFLNVESGFTLYLCLLAV